MPDMYRQTTETFGGPVVDRVVDREAIVTLTAKKVLKLLNTPGRYGDGYGLALQVKNPNNASWILRYQRDGRAHMMGLGSVHDVTLAEARELAHDKRRQLKAHGVDPLDAARAAKTKRALDAAKAMTFAQAATAYFDQNAGKWGNVKHRAQFTSTMQAYVLPKIGNLPVAAIDTGLVLRCVEPIWQSKTETASRVRGRIEAVLSWAAVRGYRAAGDNPARWKGHLDQVLPAMAAITKISHHAAVPFATIGAFVAELRESGGSAAHALEFLILTAARTGEVIGARWDEVNLDAKVWTIPAARMKAGREHRVPLSPRAVEILSTAHREPGNDFIFIGQRAGAGISSMAMTMVLKRLGRGDVTVHGFRSTFRDWCAERTNYPREVAEMALAHTIGDKVEAAYRRGDLFNKRTRLMVDWADYCDAPAVVGDVVPMRRRES